jgi:hypothetical protein
MSRHDSPRIKAAMLVAEPKRKLSGGFALTVGVILMSSMWRAL